MPNAQMKKMKNEERWKERIEGRHIECNDGDMRQYVFEVSKWLLSIANGLG